MYAARGGHATVLRRLLEPNGVNVDERNKEHATALYIACREGHTECVRLLVEAGADVNITTKTRRRPLHWYDTTLLCMAGLGLTWCFGLTTCAARA